MKVCFIGVGSIAKRHIRNLKEIYGNDSVIDVVRSGQGRLIDSDTSVLINKIYNQGDVISEHYDTIFITNPTVLHYDTLKKYNDMAESFFIEKPVFFYGTEDVGGLNLDDNKTYYVACPLRYTGVIEHLKKNLDAQRVISVRAVCSSYLPDWRPGTDIKKSYSANKSMGGGVSVDLIHEWDYLQYIFGAPKRVHSFIYRKTDVTVDSDDLAVYVGEYDGMCVEIHLDYFGRAPLRKLELITRDDTIVCDLNSQKINWLKSGKEKTFISERDYYQKKELEHFFDIVKGGAENDNTIQRALKVLNIAKGNI